LGTYLPGNQTGWFSSLGAHNKPADSIATYGTLFVSPRQRHIAPFHFLKIQPTLRLRM
jgi:hypothetical protein